MTKGKFKACFIQQDIDDERQLVESHTSLDLEALDGKSLQQLVEWAEHLRNKFDDPSARIAVTISWDYTEVTVVQEVPEPDSQVIARLKRKHYLKNRRSQKEEQEKKLYEKLKKKYGS